MQINFKEKTITLTYSEMNRLVEVFEKLSDYNLNDFTLNISEPTVISKSLKDILDKTPIINPRFSEFHGVQNPQYHTDPNIVPFTPYCFEELQDTIDDILNNLTKK